MGKETENIERDMGEESTDQSCVATSSSPPPHWWDLHATSSLSSWANPWHQPNPNSNSNSCCDVDDDVSISPSFTNASNHSALTVDSSRRLHADPPHDRSFIGSEAASDHHIWSQVFLGAGSNGELHSSEGVGEKVVDGVSSKRVSMLEPACDYLKQLESWELTNSPNWSIAPPNRHLHPCNVNVSLNDTCGLHVNNMNSDLYAHTDHDHLKLEDDHTWEMDGARRRTTPFDVNANMGHQIGINFVANNKGYYGIHNPPTNFADVISFSSRLGKPFIDNAKPAFKTSNLSDNCKKQVLQTSHPTRISGGRGQGINEGKKKRISEDNSETIPKKTKQENSTVSSTAKLQVPKVKLADRITALQQIVSPFGKTDTASVLYEAIGYIKFLQEQVQLLSNPYMKTNSPKDPWGGMMDRKEKGDARHDLRSRGLCLVPISCTPQVYRENTGSDYWTPAYRGCLYR